MDDIGRVDRVLRLVDDVAGIHWLVDNRPRGRDIGRLRDVLRGTHCGLMLDWLRKAGSRSLVLDKARLDRLMLHPAHVGLRLRETAEASSTRGTHRAASTEATSTAGV